MEDRVLTLPNAITVVRLSLLPVFLWLLVGRDERYHAALLLGAMGATDWADGYLARHLHQVSSIGKVLDPIADRLLLIGGVSAIVGVGAAPLWLGVVALTREGAVAVATITLAVLGARRIDVTWFGKAGTFGLMVAFPLFLVGHSGAGWRGPAEVCAWLAAIPGVALGLYALALYVPLARQALAEGRRVGVAS